MASTNLNTDSVTLSTDIYDVAAFIDKIRQDTITDLDETTAMVGIFGYITEIASQSLQNTLISVAETTNETLPTRAKFHKNILAHAMNLAISDINAKPATMTMMIYLPISEMEQNFAEVNVTTGRAKFILDHRVPVRIDDIEFHLDYDVIINRTRNTKGAYVYTAMYDLFEDGTTTIKQDNPISDITNPYITTLIKTNRDGIDYVAFSARLHQVTLVEIERNVLTDNDIENKTFTFEFDDQLSYFDIDVTESNGETRHLTPIYSGLLDYTVEDGEWCYYEYLDENTIRIIFSRDSYVPKLNATVTINVVLSDGYNGNITYNEEFRISLISDAYSNYNGMYAIIYPLLNGVSNGGRDKKSIDDLKKIIPREAQSRGSVINTTDLNNFFNSINDDTNYLYFYKKRDNPFERLYYGYMITKKNDTVYPTNTLPLMVEQNDFKGFAGNNNLVLSPGTVFYYYDHGTDTDKAYATLTPPEYVEGLDEDDYPYPMTTNIDGNLVRVFEYICPFLITIDDDLISSYLLTVMNEDKTFKFDSINTASDTQFITTNMNWTRKFIYTDDNGDKKTYDYKYIMTLDMIRNTNDDAKALVTVKNDANNDKILTNIKIRAILVMYADDTETNPYRYLEGTLTDYEQQDDLYTFQFEMGTDDYMDLNNRINITGIYNAKPEALQELESIESSHGYMNKNTYAKLYILADFGLSVGDLDENGEKITEETAEVILYGDDGIGNRSELEAIVPTKSDIVSEFLNNNISYEDSEEHINIITVMKKHASYMQYVYDYNQNELNTEAAILKYIRNNTDSKFVQEVLLNDEEALKVINQYSYLDLSRYTLCNVLSVDDGIDFYYDYSSMMTSSVVINPIQDSDENGNLLYKEVKRTDSYGMGYSEYKPIYKQNDTGGLCYKYSIDRIPMVKNGFLASETSMQDFVQVLEERRKYIEECLDVLEDTFGIDFKFVNTYGPSKRFYYILPTELTYNVKVTTKKLDVYANLGSEEVVGTLALGTIVSVTKESGIWGKIKYPYVGYIRLDDTSRCVSYVDNVAISLKFALEPTAIGDKTVVDGIIPDIKEYIETINEINEIHVPNIITLITNNYRDRIKYFEYLGVNEYGPMCQHLYFDESIEADLVPEFINVATTDDVTMTPDITITVY
jgi:hypothetical protein